MKEYLRTIHQRSPAHKRRFALITSGVITLTIFGLWSLVVFGNQAAQVAEVPSPIQDTSTVVAPSPFGDIKDGVANSLDAIRQQFNHIKQTVTSVNLENKYQEVRNQALSN